MNFITSFLGFYAEILFQIKEQGSIFPLGVKLLPFLLLLEFPFYILISLGVLRYFVNGRSKRRENTAFAPPVSCIVTCYSEGQNVNGTLASLAHQTYPGMIEVIAVIDGAVQNVDTYRAVLSQQPLFARLSNRKLVPLAKKMRGGRVSSLNAGLNIAQGSVVMALDGDTSFDNDMVAKAIRHFRNPQVVALSGNLRVRNANASLTARLQSLEYLLGISAGRLGLAEFGIINNISGAFGVFRKSFLRQIGGWDTGTAEDLNMTTRIKQYLGRHPGMKIVFEPQAVAHTNVPQTAKDLLRQRARWDGDLGYIYLRKYWKSFTPRILGVRNFLLYAVFGLFFQLAMPFLVLLYSAHMLVAYSLGHFFAILFLVYFVYLLLTSAFFLQYLCMVSRDKGKDLALAWVIPFYPLYTFSFRILMVWFLLRELFGKAHLDSAMAPYWVLRKGRYE